MALATFTFRSMLLHRPVPLTVLLPDNTPPKGVLYLLHGYSDGHDSFVRSGALERCCAQIPLAVVMPEAQCSFYLDTAYGQPYWQHISREVPQVLGQWLKLDIPRARSFVGGVSMGGYGAAKLALQETRRFSAAYLLSPITDLAQLAQCGFDREKDPDAPQLAELNLGAVLGHKGVAGTANDLYYLLAESEKPSLPEFTIYTGTEDFLYDEILRFNRALADKSVAHALHTSPGRHVWATWQPFLTDMAADIAARLS